MKEYDPIHQEEGKWYFWDETEADRQGPFKSKSDAREALTDYSKYILHGPPDDLPADSKLHVGNR